MSPNSCPHLPGSVTSEVLGWAWTSFQRGKPQAGLMAIVRIEGGWAGFDSSPGLAPGCPSKCCLWLGGNVWCPLLKGDRPGGSSACVQGWGMARVDS